MKRFILLSAMVLLALPAISQSRGSTRGQAGSRESERKEVKSSESTKKEPARMVNSRSPRTESTAPKGNAVNQSNGRRESAPSGSGNAVNQSSGRNQNTPSRSGSAVNQSGNSRRESAPGRTVSNSNAGRNNAPSNSGSSVNHSSGTTTPGISNGTAVNSSHGTTTYVYRHSYPGHMRTREVRVYRHIPSPAPVEIRRVNYVYRAPITVEIYWTHGLYREYRAIYPFYNHWDYHYGARVLSIPAYDAGYHVGRFRSVYGRVHEVYYAPETDLYYLYFGAPYPYHDFSVVISRREARRFSNRPEWFFNGQYIIVTGVIAMYDDRPEIEVVRRSQIVRY